MEIKCFNLSRYLTWPYIQRVVWLNELKFLTVSHHLAKISEHRLFFFFLFLSEFSFTDTDDPQDSRGREGAFFIRLYHFHPLTNIQTLFATLHVRWLSHIFNRNACIYQTATRWDFTTLSNYHLIDWWCEVCFSLFTWWFDTRFLLQQSWYGKPVYLNSHRLSPLYYKRTD